MGHMTLSVAISVLTLCQSNTSLYHTCRAASPPHTIRPFSACHTTHITIVTFSYYLFLNWPNQ
ncbi:hypothetical protein Hanom_Chr06g00537211 [Helianthus anomalus]